MSVYCLFQTEPLIRGVIFGHSFVKRLKQHFKRNGNNFSLPLQVSKVCPDVSLIGESGAGVDAMVKFFSSIRRGDKFDFMIIDIGTNDLCCDIDGKSLAKMMFSLAEDLLLHTTVL